MMKMRSLIVAGLMLLGAASVQAMVGPVEMYNAPLTEDAYVDSLLADATFNSESLNARGFGGEVFPGSGVDSDQHSFVKFDVSWLAGKTIVSAEFGIYLNAFSDYSEPSIRISRAGDGWTEDTITWNNSVALTAAAIGIGEDEQTDTLRYYVWDVFPAWNAGDLEDGYVSYMVSVADETYNNFAYFNSGEYGGDLIPYLHIEYIVPEPATMALLALGSLISLRRKSK